MTAARLHPRLVLATAAGAYLLTGAGLAFVERPGLGIAHFFYLSIALVALLGGPSVGATAGAVAAALYAAAVLVNEALPSHELLTVSTPIRLLTYASCGALIGWFARENGNLIGRLEVLAQRDRLTGLPNARAFEQAVDRRFARGGSFALLLGDLDGLREANEKDGHGGGDEVLVRLAETLGGLLRPGEELARVGGDEFAILASVRGKEEAAQRANLLEPRLAAHDLEVTFGWAVYPEEGANALGLVRVADERLYARKLVRGRRTGAPQRPKVAAS